MRSTGSAPSCSGESARAHRRRAGAMSIRSSRTKHSTAQKGAHRRRVSLAGFFNLIYKRQDLGLDFLREMSEPLCTSRPVLLPLNLKNIAPGRCISLTPFGHTDNLGFQCETCTDPNLNKSIPPKLEDPAFSKNELCSVTLTFYQQAEQVIQHKQFYLSLLNLSMDAVRNSLTQPGLLYCYLVTKAFMLEGFPIFFEETNGMLGLYLVFRRDLLHLHESYLRLLIDNLGNYDISVDSVGRSYIIKLCPVGNVSRIPTIPADNVCLAVNNLDYGDDVKASWIECFNIVSRLSQQ
ncbi:hypothetical protein [Murine herpesvirus strain 4556]|uniref:69 protein n=2 Tax=Orthoherpesviridae TaxID=3044472 RepID=O41970_MHV68|nr:unknown [Murid gammaherpesvirus 4]AXP99155.1 unknown protein [synthetic construct]QJQ80256.1 hypothetical protein MuHV4gp68 [Murine herpesvirus]UNZ86698.1 hypothetical protein [Murine herpesvirus strain 72]UNZ86775.1 hypothetical protein [Murine herpesvirus strain 4556]AAB66419.1 unknown [Murid gammaherpesvirus 4]